MPITILQLAEHRLGRPAISGQDFLDADLAIMGGCCVCQATLAAYNACPSKSGFWCCASSCIGDFGWESVEEANRDIFETCPECGQPDNCGDCTHEPAGVGW